MSEGPASFDEVMAATPMPATWAATFGLKDYWENQENGREELPQLEACERDEEE